MKKMRLESLMLLALMSASWLALQAQEVVHAVSGVVTAVHPAENSITVKTNDDSAGEFRYQKELKADIEFDKEVRSGTTEPNGFNKIGDHVVVYYFGDGDQRTIVALKDFGPAPLNVASGTIVKAKHHGVIIKTDAGKTESFNIAKDASAETPFGVVSGLKFDANEGERVTVRYLQTSGLNVAQFIRVN
ncbi:MAG: hypothetical protein WA419_22205 [Silvibacterium sp.]